VTASQGDIWRPALMRILDGASLWVYNQGNGTYTSLGYSGTGTTLILNSNQGNLLIYPPTTHNAAVTIANNAQLIMNGGTGTFDFDCSLATAAQQGVFRIPNLTNAWICIHHANSGYGDLNLGCTNSIAGGTGPYLYSTRNIINFQSNGYFTGSVSATAHTTHASGMELRDIHHSFKRRKKVSLKGIQHDPIPEKAWALHPAEDGLHILVKRTADQAVEFVLPWSQAREFDDPQPGEEHDTPADEIRAA